jgi:hypothetical protein
VFLTLVGLNAAIGIAVLVTGGLGPTGERILLTSLALTVSVMIGLACATARGTRSLDRVWRVGVACAAAGCALVIAGIWSETERVTFWRVTGTLVAVCIAVALVSLVGLPILPVRVRWTFVVTEALTAILLAMVVVGIWGEMDASWFWRIFGAVAVALAAFLLVIPVLSRVRARDSDVDANPIVACVSFCPSCGRPLVGASDEEIHCPECDATFAVRFLDREVERRPPTTLKS